jgi:uncharacterized protein (DUF736 family)
MNDFKHKENSGSLFKNKNKKAENSPEYHGSCNIEGTKYNVAAWINETKKGEKYLNFKVKKEENV